MDKPVHSFTATAMRRGLQVWRSAVVPVVLARLGGGTEPPDRVPHCGHSPGRKTSANAAIGTETQRVGAL